MVEVEEFHRYRRQSLGLLISGVGLRIQVETFRESVWQANDSSDTIRLTLNLPQVSNYPGLDSLR